MYAPKVPNYTCPNGSGKASEEVPRRISLDDRQPCLSIINDNVLAMALAQEWWPIDDYDTTTNDDCSLDAMHEELEKLRDHVEQVWHSAKITRHDFRR